MRAVQRQKEKPWGISSFSSMRLLSQRPDSHLVMCMSTRFIVLEITVPGWSLCLDDTLFLSSLIWATRRTLSSPWRGVESERENFKWGVKIQSFRSRTWQKASIRQNQYISLYLLPISTRLKRIRTWTCDGRKELKEKQERDNSQTLIERTLCPDILELTSRSICLENRWYAFSPYPISWGSVCRVWIQGARRKSLILLHLQGRLWS